MWTLNNPCKITFQQNAAENMETDENSTSASDPGVPTKRIQKQ